jgi:hypothetical protein
MAARIIMRNTSVPPLTFSGRGYINPVDISRDRALCFLAIGSASHPESYPVTLRLLQMRVESGTSHDAYFRPMGRQILAEGSLIT